MDYRAELLSRVERVLDGTLTVPAFEAGFYDFYMDEVPEAALTPPEHQFVGAVCEKLDVTAERPDAEGRRYGWMDHAQFLDWLRARHASFRAQVGSR